MNEEIDCHRKGFTQITSHVSDPLPAALAVLQVIEEENLAQRSREWVA
jgi:2,2-dialkylglycine decarboxylase (pyruvate)